MENSNLVNCVSCNNQISIYANHCIHCGDTRIGDERREKQSLIQPSIVRSETSWEQFNSYGWEVYGMFLKLAFGIPLLMWLFFLLVNIIKDWTPTLSLLLIGTVTAIIVVIIKDKVRKNITIEDTEEVTKM